MTSGIVCQSVGLRRVKEGKVQRVVVGLCSICSHGAGGECESASHDET